MILVSNRLERLAPGSRLQTDSGPLEVVSTRVHGNHHLVAFTRIHHISPPTRIRSREDDPEEATAGKRETRTTISNREEAASLRGLVLRAAPIHDPDELWAHDLIGADVVDQTGTHQGTVTQILANPACDLLELDSGSLVPVHFVTACIPGDRVEVDAPYGLFEVNT